MAYEIQPYAVKITAVAGADLSAAQYKFVKWSSGNVVVCSATTDVPCGVLQNNPTSGQEAEITVVGGTKIVGSASISVGALVGTTTAGKAAALTVGTDTTKYVAGTIISAPGADGEIGTALINCAAPHRAA
jgi:hypothetical protein